MADFFDDSSGLLSGLVGFGGGFMKGMENAEDRKYKRMEAEAKLKSTQSEEERKRFNDILEIRGKGLIPPTLGPGQKYSDTDPSKYEWDPNSPAMLSAKKQPASMLYGPDRLNIQRDNQTAAAVDRIVKDPEMGRHIQRIQGADRIQNQIDAAKSGKIKDTSQLLAEINAEYNALITGAQNAALGKLERTEYTTMASHLGSIMQKISGDPQSINSPQIMNQLETAVKELRATYQQNVQNRTKLIRRNYAHNPAAVAEQDRAIQEMLGQYGSDPSGGHGLVDSAPVQMTKEQKEARIKELEAKKARK